MAELTFKSPGVSTREIDLSGPSRVGPVGTPAGVIGTSAKGRAFVPMVFATLSEFVAEHGAVGPEKFGPMAIREWLSNARAGLYLKVLGVGDGKARVTGTGNQNSNSDDKIPTGAVKNAGFIVGSQQVDSTTGRVGHNPFATAAEGSDNATGILNLASDITLTAAADKDGKLVQVDVVGAQNNNPTALTLDVGTIRYTAVDSSADGAALAAIRDAAVKITHTHASADNQSGKREILVVRNGEDFTLQTTSHTDAGNGGAGAVIVTKQEIIDFANGVTPFNGNIPAEIKVSGQVGNDPAVEYGGGNADADAVVNAFVSKFQLSIIGAADPAGENAPVNQQTFGQGTGRVLVVFEKDAVNPGNGAQEGSIKITVTPDSNPATNITSANLVSLINGQSVAGVQLTDTDNQRSLLTATGGGGEDLADEIATLEGGVAAYAAPRGRTHFLSVMMKESAPGAGSVTITFTGTPAENGTITLISTDGTSRTYTAKDATVTSNREFVRNPGQNNAHATALAECINTAQSGQNDVNGGHGGKLVAQAQGNQVTVTQAVGGRDGNTDIASTLTNTTLGSTKFTGGKGERIFHQAGVGTADATGLKHAPVLRGVLMFPSGVVPSLAAERTVIGNNVPLGKTGVKGQAQATVTFTDAASGTITLNPGAGASAIAVDITDNQNGDPQNNPARAIAFAAAVNGADKSVTAIAVGDIVYLSQDVAGTSGNTVIDTNAVNGATVSDGFTGGSDDVTPRAAPPGTPGISPFVERPTIIGEELGGSPLGRVEDTGGKQEFVMLLNGHISNASYPNSVTASFDPQATNYFPKVFNTDPTEMQTAGHYLYTYYDVFSSYAVPSTAGSANPFCSTATNALGQRDVAMLLPTKGNRNTSAGGANPPNAENFSDRYRAATSPMVVSQKFGEVHQDLFRVHSLDDGSSGNSVYKISIENLRPSQSDREKYGRFDLLVRSFDDNDREPIVLERFSSLSLDPMSDRFISRVVGDQRIFYDFDKRAGSQKLTFAGKFANNSNYIRIELSDDVEKGVIDATALPFGFRGMPKLNIDNVNTFDDLTGAHIANDPQDSIKSPPIPMRRTISLGETPKKKVDSSLNWGIQFEADDDGREPNKNNRHHDMMVSLGAYFPDFDLEGNPLTTRASADEVDAYNNNLFSLEKIQVIVDANGNPDSREWTQAEYRRSGVKDTTIKNSDGNSVSSNSTRFVNSTSDLKLGSVRRYLKFNFMVFGGFDGVNIFDKEKSELSDVSILREVSDADKQGGKSGPTTASYSKAIDVLAERSDVDIQLLAIPGIRQPLVADRAIDAVESRFDAMYIMDPVVYDAENEIVTSSTQKVSVTNTAAKFSDRVLDTSFAATYFPDVVLTDPSTGQNIQVPPSVPVLGAFALNDQLAHPWFAPAGFTRGALGNVAETQVKLNRDNMDSLYEADMNPITAFPHTEGVVVFGQKTLLRTQSSLDRVNVRRLLIELRRRVRRVANSFIFEPNREATLARFSAQVNPILNQIQQQQGVDRFLVKIDTTTTTQTDVENNTLRGKIFLQPTRSVEFVSLDFVITNAGAEI